MKFKVGQQLKIREDIADMAVDGSYNLWSGITDLAGKTVIITGAYVGKYGPRYLVEGYGRTFLEEFFEAPIEYDGQIKGFARPLDNLGRVSIPIEYRRQLSLAVMEPVSMYMSGKVIRLKKGNGRNLDKLGRYTIPIEFRKTLGLKEDSQVDIYVEGSELCIKKIGLQCVFCGVLEDDAKLLEENGEYACEDCIERMAAKIEREYPCIF